MNVAVTIEQRNNLEMLRPCQESLFPSPTKMSKAENRKLCVWNLLGRSIIQPDGGGYRVKL